MECKICHKDSSKLGNHVRYEHGLNSKDYYDQYVKQETEGICPTCGKSTRFVNTIVGYRKFCSISCAKLNDETREKFEKTCLARYGKAYPNGFSTEQFQNNVAKKYGVKNISQSEEFKRKKEQTFLQHFNAKNNFGRNDVLAKAIQSSTSDEAWKKRQETLKRRGKRSSYELLLEELLTQNSIDYEIEYKSEVYPWHCDFYLPVYDMYIEINAHWSHGYHLFSASQDDLTKLNIWKQKAKTSPFYRQAIYVWTYLDLEKVKLAKQNNLNFRILWTKDEIYELVKQLKP